MIYESLGNAVIFALLWKLRLRNFRPGMLGALYLIGYAIVRSALTPLRMDNQFLTLGETVILAPYAISGVMVLAAFVWIFAARLWEPDPVLQEPPKKTGKRQAA
jgi:prolipoprotein diacylglyceryltransferase